jgi:hypothetical protein
LSTTNAFGGNNKFLGAAYLVVGSICFFITIVFLVKKYYASKEDKNKKL